MAEPNRWRLTSRSPQVWSRGAAALTVKDDYAWLSWHGIAHTGGPATREVLADLRSEAALWVTRNNGGRWY